MERFLAQPASQRAVDFERAGEALGMSAGAVEKDFWVCWVLRELFRLPEGTHLVFKGGTSLSKCYGAIERFSEDIDVVVEREFLGIVAGNSPETAASASERRRRVEHVKATCQSYVEAKLLPAMREAFRRRVDAEAADGVALDPDADDRQAILVPYASVLPSGGYLRPVVKIELGARSDIDPHQSAVVMPYLAVVKDLEDGTIEVTVVAAERTFWEKVSLLHEESYRASGPRARLSRHYYDVWCLDRAGVADRAIRTGGLFDQVAQHRRVFFRLGGTAQDDLVRGRIRLVPMDDLVETWAKDYDAMRDMFFGAPPTFATIMAGMRSLEQRINESSS
jgi:predicted nucleotidyltransferase component of viral defense system